MDALTVYLMLCSMAVQIILVKALGKVQVSIVKFVNHQGLLESGQCCVENNGTSCSSPCNTYFQLISMDYLQYKKQTIVYKSNFLNFTKGCAETTLYIPVDPLKNNFSVKIEVFHQHENKNFTHSRITQMIIAGQLTKSWTEKIQKEVGIELSVAYRFRCVAFFFGRYCDKYCQPNNRYSCSPEGDRVCMDGWKGELCNEAICPYCEHGVCIAPGNCLCKPGWTGDSCSQCVKHPSCANGYCSLPYECICHSPWKGIHCNQLQLNQKLNNPCDGIYCQNGGVCQQDGNKFYCLCKHGYDGVLCENKINAACDNYCKNNGTCLYSRSRIRFCLCKPGWAGNTCEISLNSCLTYPCQNNGTCIEKFGDEFVCKCPPQFYGSHCQLFQSHMEVIHAIKYTASIKIVAATCTTIIVTLLLIAICFLIKNARHSMKSEETIEEMEALNHNLNNEHTSKEKCTDKMLFKDAAKNDCF